MSLVSDSLENLTPNTFIIEPFEEKKEPVEEFEYLPSPSFEERFSDLYWDVQEDFGNQRSPWEGHIDFKRKESSWNGPSIEGPSLVLARISDISDSEYHYTINFTQDMDELFQILGDYHGCRSEIEVLLINECKSQNDEIKVKYKIIEHGYDIDRDMFEIDSFIYNLRQ